MKTISVGAVTPDEAFNLFRPTLDKLKKEFRSIDHIWWRSRWYEWINMINDDPQWERKHNLYLIWPLVWSKYCSEFIPESFLDRVQYLSKNNSEPLQIKLF